jgi:phage terminase large subunit-like protein
MVDELDRLMTAMRALPGIDSPASWVASRSPDQQLQWLASLNDHDVQRLEHLWPFWARTGQLPRQAIGRFWLFRGGRGGGKTRAGAEAVRAWIEDGCCRRVALVAPTITAGRQVMIEGESGLLAVCPPW